jgi:hypothetical protein
VVYASSSSALATGSALTFDGTNFGVGTAASYKLHVSGTGTVSSRTYATDATGDASFFVGNNNGRLAGPLVYGSTKTAYGALGSDETAFYSNVSTTIMADGASQVIKFAAGGNAEGLRLTSSSLYTASGINVGFGTSSTSSARLTVAGVSNTGYTSFLANGTGTAYNLWRMTNTGGDLRIGIESSTAVGILTGTTNYSSSIGTLTATDLQFGTNSTVRATIDSSGNVGIGTSSPADKLEVARVSSSNSTGGLSLTNSDASGYGSAVSWRLKLDGTNISTVARTYVESSGTTASFMAFQTTVASTLAERARIDSSGNLLVGKTSADYTSVGCENRANGQINAATANLDFLNMYNNTAGAYRFYVSSGGTINATSITISAISDQRLKENVRDIETGLDAILSLKPRRFDWKDGKGQDKKNVAGFIAQEFETVFPECVSTSKAGEDGIEYKNINHETLIPTLVKAIQEQQAMIESLRQRLSAANL